MTIVMVTGSAGFIGKNLSLALKRESGIEVIEIDIGTHIDVFERGLAESDAIIHLAGINRTESNEEFEEGNVGYLMDVLSGLERCGRNPIIILSSSTQAALDNPYGRSKKRAEEALEKYSMRTGAPIRIFRLPGVFGKWGRPNYNSVVATFCHNIAYNLPIAISDPAREIELIHVDDVIAAFLATLKARSISSGPLFLTASPVFRVALGRLAEKLHAFRSARETLIQTSLDDPFDRRLYGTYMSHLPDDKFDYSLTARVDERGMLAELLKLGGYGQIFVSRTRPGHIRGNHYHDLKVEKFIVLDGDAVIRFRNVATDTIAEYYVSGREVKVVDIPPGWTHSIENIGKTDMIVLFWASELFDLARPDTYTAKVLN